MSCSYCSETCEAPAIDGNIGFFDGFKSSLVLTVYTILAVFTVFYQIYNCFIKKPRVAKDYEQILKSNERQPIENYKAKINQTVSSKDIN